MVIATIKAALVMAFFMHMAYDKPFNVIIFLSSFGFVALFLIFTMSDSGKPLQRLSLSLKKSWRPTKNLQT